MDKSNKKAFELGFICIFSYLCSYFLRKTLGVATPLILADGAYTKELIGTFSSLYMLFYAGGQLINGFIGDIVNPKKMVLIGMSASAISTIAFPLSNSAVLSIICFSIQGFALSMLRGPITKVIAENTTPKQSRLCCVVLSCTCYAGPFIASLLTIIFDWKWAFLVSGGITLLVGISAFFLLNIFEKKGLIEFKPRNNGKFKFDNILAVFRIRDYIFFIIIAGFTEVSTSTISFWLPTYFNEYLGFSVAFSNTAFSVINVSFAITPIVALFLYKLINSRAVLLLRFSFAASAFFFVIAIFVRQQWANMILVFLSMFALSIGASIVWSIYIPSLGRTGKVSSANGVMDCSGYLIAALANIIFTAILSFASWQGMLVGWLATATIALLICIFKKEARID